MINIFTFEAIKIDTFELFVLVNIRGKKLGFIFFFTALAVLVLLTFTLIAVKSSYKEQLSRTYALSVQSVFGEIKNYQENIENIVIGTLTGERAEANASPYPFIKIISNPSLKKNSLPLGNYCTLKSKTHRPPFSAIICTPNEIWLKSSVNVENGNVEYAYRFDHLLGRLNCPGQCPVFITVRDHSAPPAFVGLKNKTWGDILSPESNFPVGVSSEGKTFVVFSIAEFLATTNTLKCNLNCVIEITKLKSAYSKTVLLVIIFGALTLGIISLSAVAWWKNSAVARNYAKFDRLNDEEINRYLNNHAVRQLFNATENGIRIINTNFDIVAVNSSFYKLSGFNADQLKGQKCYNIFHGLNCHTANCPLEQIKSGETAVKLTEFRYKMSGEKINCAYTVTPLINANNELIGIIEDCKDITEIDTVKEILTRTEKQYHVFMDSLPLGVFIEDAVTHEIFYQNTYLQKITGGKDIKGFLLPGKAETLSKTPLASEEENEMLDINGNWKYFQTYKFPFDDVNNHPGIGGIMIDITKKKEAEQYSDVLSKAIENSPVSVAILSPETEIEFINPSFANLTGYNIDEIYSKEIVSLNLEYNPGSKLLSAGERVKKGQIWQGEIHLKNRESEHSWVSASFTPIFDANGHFQHAVAIMENITKRKEYEKEILLAKSKAEESDRLKLAFLSNLSHEIRTPLNAIIGFSSLLSDNDLSSGERSNISEIIYRNSNALLRLIENLIEISEIETGQVTIKKKEFSVNTMMSEIYRQLLDEEKKAANVRLHLRKEVQNDDLIILSDQSRLQQVLIHLLSNSCKFTENGFIEFGYSLKDESTLLFYVIDSGIGIEPKMQSLIFNPFRQVDDSNTRKYGGMGLGLAISKHIVEKLGGKIWINSTLKSGTNAFFTIPFIPVNSKFETEQSSIKTDFTWNNKTILVADDVDANYMFLKAALKKTNANILWARNGSEAVDLVKRGSTINLILMDLVMPEMDGFEATKMIKSINHEIPIIGQTAFPNQKNGLPLTDSGFDFILEKPIKINSMLKVLDGYLSN